MDHYINRGTRGFYLDFIFIFSKLTLHEDTKCMEETVDGNVAKFSLGSYGSVNGVIEKLFVAIPAHQRLWKRGKTGVLGVLGNTMTS